MEDFCPNLPILPEHLAARIREEWLRIHSKKLEGADTGLCLRDAYDACAIALMDEGWKLDDAVLCEYIPGWVVHWAAKKEWFPPDPPPPPDHLREDMKVCLSARIQHWQAMGDQTVIPHKHLAARIRAEWLTIHSKKLEGADTDLCIREAYDVFAAAVRDFGDELDDVSLCQGIPTLILYCYGDEWLSEIPRAQRYEDLLKRVSGRIAYWQAEALKQKGLSPLHKRWESMKEMGRLMDGPHEKIPESFLRTTLAQQYGIKPEEVTWDQIAFEVERLSLSANYSAVEVVSTASETDEDDQPRFFYQLPADLIKPWHDALLAALPADPSVIDESSPLGKLDASPPTPAPSDELQRRVERLLSEYLLDQWNPSTAQAESADSAQPARVAPNKKRKRGPRPDHETALRVAEIVARVAPDGEWRGRLDDVCEALDDEKIPIPARWRNSRCWADYPEKPLLVKAVEYRLQIAKQGMESTPETLS